MKKLNILRFLFLSAALLFIIIGAVVKEPLSVYQKAAVICLECIGIG